MSPGFKIIIFTEPIKTSIFRKSLEFINITFSRIKGQQNTLCWYFFFFLDVLGFPSLKAKPYDIAQKREARWQVLKFSTIKICLWNLPRKESQMESAQQTLCISLMMDLTSNQSKRLLQMMKRDVSKIQRSRMLTMTNVKRGNQYTILFFLSLFFWNVFSIGVFFPFPGLKTQRLTLALLILC